MWLPCTGSNKNNKNKTGARKGLGKKLNIFQSVHGPAWSPDCLGMRVLFNGIEKLRRA